MVRHLIQRTRFVFTTIILTTVYCLLTTFSSAQVYPVLVNTTMRGPYSLSLTDYATPTYDRIQANVYLADITKNNYPVKVRLVMRSVTGINITTSPGNEVGPIYLDGGVNHTLTGSDVYSLFDANRLTFSGISYNQYRANGLPEGNYQFHFEIVDAQFGIVISNVNVGYANAWLILNDPPIINKPSNGITIVPTLPQNIFFQWTPRHTGSPNSAFTTEYDVQLVEIYPADANPNDVMLSAPIIFEKSTFATAYNYSIADPNLIEGKWYAFRVRAHDQNGLDLFKNQGYSEVFSFYYGQPCPVPQQLQAEATGATSILVSWNQDDNLSSVKVEYKLLSDRNWRFVESYTNSIELTGLTAGAQYQIRVSGNCSNNSSDNSSEKIVSLSGPTAMSCSAPQYYNIERTELIQPNQKIKISWLPASNAVSYSVNIQGNGIAKTYTKRARDITTNTSGQDLFSTGSVTDDYFSVEDQITNAPFTCTFEVTCADGSVTRGDAIPVNLDASNVSASSCNLPQNTEVTALAQSLTEVKVSWNTEPWFNSYKLRYRILASDAFFNEVTSTEPFVVLTNLDLDQLYEYQIIYTCLNGSMTVGPFNTFSITTNPSLFNTNTASTGDCFPPVNYSYQLTNTTATITWESDRETDSYYVYWKELTATLWDSIEVNTTEVDITNLTIGSTYVYNIRPVCKVSGLLGIASSTGRFTLNAGGTVSPKDCPTPNLEEAIATSSVEVQVEAELNPLYTNYLIEIRVFNSTYPWMQVNAATAQKLIAGLEPDILYEYHIAAFCGTTQSDFSITDTVRTLVTDDEFVCAAGSGYTVISSQIPIASFAVGDEFTAADFDLKVKSITSERPYNGEATAKIPYLKYSTFVFQMQDVWINEDGQMYAGKIFMKGAFIAIIDPKLTAQLNSFIDKMNEGIEKAQMYAAMGDSIITSFRAIMTSASKPIDWAKYQGWNATQLFNEGKRLVGLANALVKQGTPQSIAAARDMIIEGIELIKAAVALGRAGVQLVTSRVSGWLKRALDKVEDQTDSTKTITEDAQQVLDPVLVQSLNETLDPDAQQYTVLPDDEVFQQMAADSVVESSAIVQSISSDTRLGDAYTNSDLYARNKYKLEIFNKILMYIKFYSNQSNAATLVTAIETDLRTTLGTRHLDDLTDAEMTQLLTRVEASIKKYLDAKAKTSNTTTN